MSLNRDQINNNGIYAGKRAASSGETRRMSSITRKLHWNWIRTKAVRSLFMDLLLVFLLAAGWCADREYAAVRRIDPANGRDFVTVELDPAQVTQEIDRVEDLPRYFGADLRYRVTSPDGKVLLDASFLLPMMVIGGVLTALLALQLLGFLPSYLREDRAIRRILAPINEIALQADALSRLSFTEDKYQVIEEAIEHIEPGEAGQGLLHFGDSDLAGIEAAMNNLLVRMRDTMRQQARFVNDASHELRTPIAVIQGYANMLDRWGKTDEKILDESIAAIKNESEHMDHLVEQLLFLARGDSGKTVLAPEQVQTDVLMREIYEESFMIDEKHRYRLLTDGQPAEVTADPGLLKQAVRILIDNAAKYTPEGEEILLSYGMQDGRFPYLQVQDLGIGMEESELPRIFDRFFRSDEVRGSEGTGLGLSIAKWIVDKHRGHFEILSRKELGTRIRIVLPER